MTGIKGECTARSLVYCHISDNLQTTLRSLRTHMVREGGANARDARCQEMSDIAIIIVTG